MNTKQWLEQVAYVEQQEIVPEDYADVYLSKFDGSYITMKGQEDAVSHLAELEVTEELTHGVGLALKIISGMAGVIVRFMVLRLVPPVKRVIVIM